MLGEYSIPLVVLSYVISVLGSFAALQLVTAISEAVMKADRRKAVLFAGVAMGAGAIWSMHFVGMLAQHVGMPIAYDLAGTLYSVIVAIAACTAGLALIGMGRSGLNNLIPAAVCMGAGVAGMHYMGMEAMLMPARIEYNLNILLISVIIAVAAAAAALWMAFELRGVWQKFGSALVMGVAVCGMHYTGMAAAEYVPIQAAPKAGFAGALSGQHLGVATVFISLAVVQLTLVVNRWYRQRPLTPA